MSKNTLIRFGFAYTVAATVQKGIGFISFMYLATILTVQDYAAFGIYYSLFTIIGAISYSGIIEVAISSLKDYNHGKERAILFKISNGVFLIMSGLSALIFLPIVLFGFLRDTNSLIDFLIILATALLSTFFTFQAMLVRLNEEYKTSLALSFVPQVISYIFGLIFSYLFRNSLAFFFGAGLGYVVSLSLFKIKWIRFNGFLFDRVQSKYILINILPYLLITAVSWTLGYGNTFVVDWFFESSDVALFVFLYTISSILQLVASSMNQVWSPRFYTQYLEASSQEIESNYDRFALLQGAILGLVGGALLVVVPYLSNFSDSLSSYSNSEMELFWLFIGYVVCIPWWRYQNYYFINNQGSRLMRITLLSGIIGLAVWWLSMLIFGRLGIYVGSFLNSFIRSLLLYIDARRNWAVSFDYQSIIVGIIVLVVFYLV